jgi:hypothetical protein
MYNYYTLTVTIELNEDLLIQEITEATKKDKIIQEMLENSAENKNLTTNENGLVYLRNLIYIPNYIRTKIIKQHHNDPMHRYIGIEKTAELILRNYYFLNIRRKV